MATFGATKKNLLLVQLFKKTHISALKRGNRERESWKPPKRSGEVRCVLMPRGRVGRGEPKAKVKADDEWLPD